MTSIWNSKGASPAPYDFTHFFFVLRSEFVLKSSHEILYLLQEDILFHENNICHTGTDKWL